MKTKILKFAGISLALITCLTVFGLNFSRVTSKPGKDVVSLSVMQAKAQSGEDCDYGGANGSWTQIGPSTYWTNRYGQICYTANYQFFCYYYAPYECDASCYEIEKFDFCS